MSERLVFNATGEMVILPRKDYEALLEYRENEKDLKAIDLAIAEIDAGAETFPDHFVARLLETDSPLKEWRKYRDLSQTQLANAAGLRQATVSAIEGGSCPRVDTARRIAKVLNCDLDDLF